MTVVVQSYSQDLAFPSSKEGGPAAATAGALLSIDLNALRANYRLLNQRCGGKAAAVLKADAYGLGAAVVGPVLAEEGCTTFFVAHLDEALKLRAVLADPALRIAVLHGQTDGCEDYFVEHHLTPVLNCPSQLTGWKRAAVKAGRRLPAFIQVDTGMSRLGLHPSELMAYTGLADGFEGIEIVALMSHLACADEPDHPANKQQLAAFKEYLSWMPKGTKGCFANSSGIFLGEDYHFDLCRPGAALYGVAPVEGQPNPMRQVVRLQGKVIQDRYIKAGDSVGYGYSYASREPKRIATVSVGYADGFLRSLSNRACAYMGDVALPLIGRVSMDTVTLDVSVLGHEPLPMGSHIDLIGPHNDINKVAKAAGTIGYEILTSLGHRYHRHYRGAVVSKTAADLNNQAAQ